MADSTSSAGAPTAPAPVTDLDWSDEQIDRFGRDALALVVELLGSLPDRPVARDEGPAEIRAALLCDVPDDPMPIDQLSDHLRALALDHSMLPGHPRFMAYISGAGTPPGAVADLVAAAINQNLGGWLLSPAASEIERQVVRWFSDLIGYDHRGGGLLTAGGASATLVALKTARDHRTGWDVRNEGTRPGAPLTCYASAEAHVVVDRAADIIGIGAQQVRHIPVDPSGRMDVRALRDSIAADRRAGLLPFAVVGTAGTTAIGAIDPLDAIADVCEAEGLWFHVDGAYGAPATLVPELRPLFAGIERADSVALDPHKWLYVPLGVGCVLVRDAEALPESFGVEASYVHQDRELVDRGEDAAFWGIDFSRGFSALKVWISLLAYGRDAYERRIRHDCELARYLHDSVRALTDLEPMGPVTLSIACFRYVPADVDRTDPESQAYLDRLNERIMTTIQTDGRAFCSNAEVGGRYALRACIVNFRTEAPDVDTLLDVATELGAAIHADRSSGAP